MNLVNNMTNIITKLPELIGYFESKIENFDNLDF